MISKQIIFHVNGPFEASHVNSSAHTGPEWQIGMVWKREERYQSRWEIVKVIPIPLSQAPRPWKFCKKQA